MCSRTDWPRAASELPVLLETLAASLVAESDVRRWVVAFSGGLDSSLLLELCARLELPQPLVAVHIDHQLQAASADWAAHCRQHCQRLGVPLTCLQVIPDSASEASARSARYAAFEKFLEPGDCLLLAQHADDQAETLLLRLLRGSGVAGLAAMPVRRALGRARLLRPLLDQSREQLERVAAELEVVSVQDPTNAQDHYDRNWLRLHILPRLKQHWPALLQRCRDTASVMRDADEMLKERALDDLALCRLPSGGLSVTHIRDLSAARQRNLMHFWIARQTGQRLSRQRLQNLLYSLLSPRADAEPVERFGEQQLRRYRDGLYLLPDPLPESVAECAPVIAGQPLALPCGELTWQRSEQGFPDGMTLTLGYRQGGERLRPLGRGGSVRLKQLLQESGVPPWLRPLQPILWSDDQLLAVPGICLCEYPWVENGWMPQWSGFGLS